MAGDTMAVDYTWTMDESTADNVIFEGPVDGYDFVHNKQLPGFFRNILCSGYKIGYAIGLGFSPVEYIGTFAQALSIFSEDTCAGLNLQVRLTTSYPMDTWREYEALLRQAKTKLREFQQRAQTTKTTLRRLGVIDLFLDFENIRQWCSKPPGLRGQDAMYAVLCSAANFPEGTVLPGNIKQGEYYMASALTARFLFAITLLIAGGMAALEAWRPCLEMLWKMFVSCFYPQTGREVLQAWKECSAKVGESLDWIEHTINEMRKWAAGAIQAISAQLGIVSRAAEALQHLTAALLRPFTNGDLRCAAMNMGFDAFQLVSGFLRLPVTIAGYVITDSTEVLPVGAVMAGTPLPYEDYLFDTSMPMEGE